MKRFIILLVFIVFNAFANRPASDAVDYRQSAFTLFQANLSSMGAMIYDKKPYNERALNHNAKNLKALSTMPWMFFEVTGSDLVKGTRAKKEVWNEPQKFKNIIKHFKKVVAKLDKTVKPKNNDKELVKHAFLDVAKTCKGCHKKFKAK